MEDIDIIWSKTLDILKNEIDGIQFETWINPLKILSSDGNDIVLEAENDFSKTQVDTKNL